MGFRSILRKGPTIRESLRAVVRERTAVALIVSGIAILISIVARWETSEQRASEPYVHAMKLSWSDQADIVVLGDSRVLNGVFPGAIQQVLPDRKVLNYAFGGLGYSEEYMRAAVSVLDLESERKALLLGITPISLTPGAVRKNHFLAYRSKPKRELQQMRGLGRYTVHLRRVTEYDLMVLFQEGLKIRTVVEARPDGSVARRTIPENPKASIPGYLHAFDDENHGPVSSEVVDVLLGQVSRWVERGIAVYVFRPPTVPELRVLEDELSGFREEEFIARITESGAVWLEPDGGPYRTYDGSHLNPTSAARFSRDLARGILRAEEMGGRPRGLKVPPVVTVDETNGFPESGANKSPKDRE